jgi:hypothetical protein
MLSTPVPSDDEDDVKPGMVKKEPVKTEAIHSDDGNASGDNDGDSKAAVKAKKTEVKIKKNEAKDEE